MHKLDDDTEQRDVRCTVHELESNELVITRDDTGEEIERRTMTAQERQGQWDWAGAGQAKVDAAKANAAAEDRDDDGESDDADSEIARLAAIDATLDDDESAPTTETPKPRGKRSSKSSRRTALGLPASKKRAKSRSAAAHAR